MPQTIYLDEIESAIRDYRVIEFDRDECVRQLSTIGGWQQITASELFGAINDDGDE